MIEDLSIQDSHISRRCDILIVGAGIAGLILATRLRKAGLHIVVLECGGRAEAAQTHPLKEFVQTGDDYKGVSQGRSHCLGGTSTRWGGALLPYLDQDLEARPHIGQEAFPVSMAQLRKYVPDVEAIFDLSSGSYEEDFVKEAKAESQVPVGDRDFWARFAKWPRFRARNVASLFKDELSADRGIEVWLNSTVTGFNLMPQSDRLRSVEARSLNGRRISVSADRFVICAGAIESTRLLLLLDRQHDQRIFERCNSLGRYFYDHVSAPVARIAVTDIEALNRLAAFRFSGTTMRSLRYELSPAAQRRQMTGSAFAHISFKTLHPTGFDALRTMMRATQRGSVDYGAALAVARDVPYLLNTARWRYVHKQLLWPRPAHYDLHLVVEQLPKAANRIFLTRDQNAFGMPVAAINWNMGHDERRTFEIFPVLFDAFWKRSGLQRVGSLEWIRTEQKTDENTGASDVYHPGGTTRMGTDSRTAVVDDTLRTFAVRNLWVSSTSTFPTGGGANPTMTLILFTLRLADHLTRQRECVASPAAAFA
ncbi:MAG TPA: FAD-dependent oxidoreductase [Methylovirgula sp.]|nr:FAD-dependent oxidoreductase [Methylovirgula sp.]